jgi:mono/diheme cytochrome c family protein
MIALLSVLALLGQVAAAPPPPTQTAAGTAERGKRLFATQTCYFCHGTVGQGGGAGARVAVVARNAQSFIRYVRRPTGQMPAYTEKILSDQDLTDIFTFLRSLPTAKSPDEIPLLRLMK